MQGHLEYSGRSTSAVAAPPGAPELPWRARIPDGKIEQRTMAAPSGRSCYYSCPVAGGCDDRLIADLQAYLRLFCRRRALIEIGDDKLALHFQAAGEAAVFSGLWMVWAAAGLLPTSRCQQHDDLARLSKSDGMGEIRR